MPRAFLDLGAAEYLEGEGVCIIEWADRVREWLPAGTLWVELEVTGPEGRRARHLGSRRPRRDRRFEQHLDALGLIRDGHPPAARREGAAPSPPARGRASTASSW